MKTIKKIAISLGGIALVSTLAVASAWVVSGQTEERMQQRQEAIIKNMAYNPWTRCASEDEFMRVYRAEQRAYDSGQGEIVTAEDLKQDEARRNYWPYKTNLRR